MTAAPFTAQTETADAAFALIADKEYVMPGGEVTVTVRLTEGAISSGEFYVDYDKSVFSTNPSTDVIGPGISDMSVSAANIGNDGVRCNLAFTYPYYHRQDATTDIFTVKLTIHEEAVMGSEYEIALRAESLTCAKSNSDPTIELIDASFEPATVKVIVGDESAIGECTWELDGTVLTIKGEGAMKDFASASEVPWPTSITEVIIEEGVTNIGANAFLNCASLISATIPKSVTDIGYRAFFFCSNLATITLPDGVTNIGEDAFRACASLTSVTIPDSVTSIGMWAFSYCISLTSVTLGDSGIKIGNSAFYDCTDLTDVWCQGYESNKSKIEIASGNECLTSATWYYYKEGYSDD